MSKLLVLASGSKSRQAMLQDAGVPFEVVVPDVDEDQARKSLLADKASPQAVALELAKLKARQGSSRSAGRLTLGADQVLVCDGCLFKKADNTEEARSTLEKLRGRRHKLISAAALIENGSLLWERAETAELQMRGFSDAFLESYLTLEGDAILGSVGCYRIEGRGAQLFGQVSGDQFVIRGLPLIPLLEALRVYGDLTS